VVFHDAITIQSAPENNISVFALLSDGRRFHDQMCFIRPWYA
jgi:hypothetical protein